MTDDDFSYDGPPLDDAEAEAFEQLAGGLGMDDVPPNEQEARAFLGDAVYEQMRDYNNAANAFSLLSSNAAINLTNSKAKMWRAVAFTLRIGAITGVAVVVDWLVR